jgi:pimeloyl-ACP methyl ester carboxylesterase
MIDNLIVKCNKTGYFEGMITTDFISTNGITLHVAQAGSPDNPPVLMLHGFPEFWYSWMHVVEPLSQDYHLIIPDQRGYNLSSKPPHKSDYNLNIIAQDIIGLLDALGIDKVKLVAHDWGAAAAWWFACLHPERLESLAILNAPHHIAFVKALKNTWRQRFRSLYMGFFQMANLPEAVLRWNNWTVAKWMFTGLSRPNTFSPKDLAFYQQAWEQPDAITSMLNWYRAGLPKERPTTNRITVPTLIIWGEKDAAFIPSLAYDSLDYCDDGRLHTIAHAGHWVQHEAPEMVCDLLLAFWQGKL